MKLTLALTFVFILFPALASAQLSAAEHFAAGVRDMERDDFEAALGRFEAAEDLHPHGVNQFNIGGCLEELGRLREAITRYQFSLESAQLTDDRASESRVRIERLQMRLGTVHIDGNNVEASLGERSCTTPCSLPVDPGMHHVRWPTGDSEVVVPEGGEVHVVIPPAVAVSPPAPPPVQQDRITPNNRPRSLMISGGLAVVLGVAGSVAFGIHTLALKEDFDRSLTPELQRDGVRFRRLTNASIAIAGAGAVLFVVGLILRARSPETPLALDQEGLSISF